jgi:hypothetical protein
MLMKRTIVVIVIFSVAMAALESAVVVYLRALFYPDGFSVVLKIIDEKLLLIEIFRELTTLVMLWAIGFLAGRTRREQLAYFLLAFAVWDIFYYGWLKLFIDWPSSLLDWDILFLIPWAWIGPVLAPLVLSFAMILFSWILLGRPERKFVLVNKISILTGILVILYTFLRDYGKLIFQYGIAIDEEFMSAASSSIPSSYGWLVFWLGFALLIFGILKKGPTQSA